MTEITLYEYEPTRSARCRWTLLEAGLDFHSEGGSPAVIGTPELLNVHPLGKLPAAIIDGKPLFESAAIATAIADLAPGGTLVAKPGTWERTLHDQWVHYAATEMEAWAWSNFLNTVILPEPARVPECLEQNAGMFKRGASALDKVLGESEYLVENRFTVTDIIVSYTVNFGRRQGFLDGFSNLHGYLDRLFTRKHCTLDQS